MATFPQGLTHIDAVCTMGERRLLNQLKRCLPDDHLVWHRLPLGEAAHPSEFVVLSPRQGLLFLAVRDWRRQRVVSATADRVEVLTPLGLTTEANPLQHLRANVKAVVEPLHEDHLLQHADGPFLGKPLFPNGWGVVFSHMLAEELADAALQAAFPAPRTLTRNDLDESRSPADFSLRLWGLFTVHYPHTLTPAELDRMRWHLFPELRLPSPGAMPGHLPAASQPARVLDIQQEQVARSLGPGHRVLHGAAGTGKTLLLLWRAQQLAAETSLDRPVLVLCMGRSLADHLEAWLRQRGLDQRVQVRTFRAWCLEMAERHGLVVPPGIEATAATLTQTLVQAAEAGELTSGLYTAVLVDDAHEFEDDGLRLAAHVADGGGAKHLLVVYNDTLAPTHRARQGFSFSSVGIQARGRSSVLRVNHRNSAEVLSLAVQCIEGLPGATPAEARSLDDGQQVNLRQYQSRQGTPPEFFRAATRHDESALLAERIAEALRAGHPLDDIAVVFRTLPLMRPLARRLARREIPFQSMGDEGFVAFDWTRPSVKVLTLEGIRGLEFPKLFVAGLQALAVDGQTEEDALRWLYAAATRCSGSLVLTACGDSALVHGVRVALKPESASSSGLPVDAPA